MPIIQLDLDSSGAVSGLRQYEAEAHKAATATNKISKADFSGLDSKLGAITSKYRLLAGVITGIAGSAVAMLGKSLIMSASDMEETQGKFNVVFKGMTEDAEVWAAELSKSYGMSIQESHKYLSSMQDLLVPMGLARDSAGKLSNEVVKLATDLGSFNNVKTADVMADIQSAVVGNFETMKKYGVVLSATRVEQEAYALGLAHSKDDLTSAAKAQAVYSLVVKGSKDALGDFNRTQGSFANQLKISVSRVKDLAQRIGSRLLPMATKALSSFTKWIGVQQNMNAVVAKSISVIQFLVNGFNGLNVAAHGIIVVVAEMANITIKALTAILEPLAMLSDGFNTLLGIDHTSLVAKLQGLKDTTQAFTESAVEGFEATLDSAIKTSDGFDKARQEALKFGIEAGGAAANAKTGLDSVVPSVDALTQKLAGAGAEAETLGDKLSGVSSSGAEAGAVKMAAALAKEEVEAKKLAAEVVNLTSKINTLEGAQRVGALAANKHAQGLKTEATAAKGAAVATAASAGQIKVLADTAKTAADATGKATNKTYSFRASLATTTEGIKAQVLALRTMNRELDEASKARQNSVFSSFNPEAYRQQMAARAKAEREMYDQYVKSGGTQRGWYGLEDRSDDVRARRDKLDSMMSGGGSRDGRGTSRGHTTTMTNNNTERNSSTQIVNFNQQITASDVARITASLTLNAARR